MLIFSFGTLFVCSLIFVLCDSLLLSSNNNSKIAIIIFVLFVIYLVCGMASVSIYGSVFSFCSQLQKLSPFVSILLIVSDPFGDFIVTIIAAIVFDNVNINNNNNDFYSIRSLPYLLIVFALFGLILSVVLKYIYDKKYLSIGQSLMKHKD